MNFSSKQIIAFVYGQRYNFFDSSQKFIWSKLEISRIRNHSNPQNTKNTTKFGPKSPHLN